MQNINIIIFQVPIGNCVIHPIYIKDSEWLILVIQPYTATRDAGHYKTLVIELEKIELQLLNHLDEIAWFILYLNLLLLCNQKSLQVLKIEFNPERVSTAIEIRRL